MSPPPSSFSVIFNQWPAPTRHGPSSPIHEIKIAQGCWHALCLHPVCKLANWIQLPRDQDVDLECRRSPSLKTWSITYYRQPVLCFGKQAQVRASGGLVRWPRQVALNPEDSKDPRPGKVVASGCQVRLARPPRGDCPAPWGRQSVRLPGPAGPPARH